MLKLKCREVRSNLYIIVINTIAFITIYMVIFNVHYYHTHANNFINYSYRIV